MEPVRSTLVVRCSHLHAAVLGATLHAGTLLYISGTCLHAASLLRLMSDQAMGSEEAGPQSLDSIPLNAPISDILALQVQVEPLRVSPVIPCSYQAATAAPAPLPQLR